MWKVFPCVFLLSPWGAVADNPSLVRQASLDIIASKGTDPKQIVRRSPSPNSKGAIRIATSDSTQPMVQALFTVGIAEIFDKTWFVVLMMALSADKWMAFWGGLTGLQLHVAIAAGLGFSISRVLALSTLNFLAAAAFGVMTVFYAYEWYSSEPDSDVLTAGKEEAAEAITFTSKDRPKLLEAFSKTMWLTFIAEWGDRTQIAMIGLHSSKPLVPVCFGSAIAFLLLTASAVLTAKFIGQRQLSESVVKGISALSFAIFTVLSIRDGWLAARSEGLTRS